MLRFRERKQNPTSTEMAPPAGKNMAADDVPVAADELEGQDSGHGIVYFFAVSYVYICTPVWHGWLTSGLGEAP